jgi:hypothetical protein
LPRAVRDVAHVVTQHLAQAVDVHTSTCACSPSTHNAFTHQDSKASKQQRPADPSPHTPADTSIRATPTTAFGRVTRQTAQMCFWCATWSKPVFGVTRQRQQEQTITSNSPHVNVALSQ